MRQAAPGRKQLPVSELSIRHPAKVELGNRYDGPVWTLHGELGAYQFRREVWFQHTREPFSEARTAFADEIAARHYQWITNQLICPPASRSAAWNLAAALEQRSRRRQPRPHSTRSTRDYANRVRNLDAEPCRNLRPPRAHSALRGQLGGSDAPAVAPKPVVEVHAPLTPRFSIVVASELPIANGIRLQVSRLTAPVRPPPGGDRGHSSAPFRPRTHRQRIASRCRHGG